MSKSQILRALVNERLAAAAEDIFVLIERTIVEYEEELSRAKEENQTKQQLLDKEPCRANVQIPSTSPGPGLNQEMTETPQIKEEPEEQSVKQEEEQLPVSVPESSAVCVTTQESSLLQQRQTEHREETQGEDISSEPHFHSETEGHNDSSDTDNDDDWGPFTRIGTGADGTHNNQVQIGDRSSKLFPQSKTGPETTVHSGHISGADVDEKKKHHCHVCIKRFGTKQQLQAHIRVHTGEKPFICSICKKTFTQKSSLNLHTRTHTGDKPYSCSFCSKTFALKFTLDIHTRTHTGEKPYSCSVCLQRFTQPSHLRSHNRMHTGERPYSCTLCEKTFTRKNNLRSHMSTHTV